MNFPCTDLKLRPSASPAMWQEAHVLPFVPRLWKNGLFSSMAPAVLKVARKPVGSRKGNKFGMTIAEAAVASARSARIGTIRRVPDRFMLRPHELIRMSCPPHG